MLESLKNLSLSGQAVISALMWVIVFGGMYFVLFRPQQKKRKQEEDMKKNIKIGDEIITIGGIIGKVISVKESDDSIVVESGSNKIRMKRWAISGLASGTETNPSQK